MLSLSFDGECICARDYAITKVLLYLCLSLNAKRSVCEPETGVEDAKNGVI